jgi:hypothetical protein
VYCWTKQNKAVLTAKKLIAYAKEFCNGKKEEANSVIFSLWMLHYEQKDFPFDATCKNSLTNSISRLCLGYHLKRLYPVHKAPAMSWLLLKPLKPMNKLFHHCFSRDIDATVHHVCCLIWLKVP